MMASAEGYSLMRIALIKRPQTALYQFTVSDRAYNHLVFRARVPGASPN
jgi:hypothetical protein